MDAMEKGSFNSTARIKISGRMGEDDTRGCKKEKLAGEGKEGCNET